MKEVFSETVMRVRDNARCPFYAPLFLRALNPPCCLNMWVCYDLRNFWGTDIRSSENEREMGS